MHGHSWRNGQYCPVCHNGQDCAVTMGSTVLSVTMGSTVLSVCHSDLQHGLFKTVQTVPIVEDKFVSRSITDNCFACSVQCTDYTARK